MDYKDAGKEKNEKGIRDAIESVFDEEEFEVTYEKITGPGVARLGVYKGCQGYVSIRSKKDITDCGIPKYLGDILYGGKTYFIDRDLARSLSGDSENYRKLFADAGMNLQKLGKRRINNRKGEIETWNIEDV